MELLARTSGQTQRRSWRGPLRTAELKGQQIGRQNETLNEIFIFCVQQILNYSVKYKKKLNKCDIFEVHHFQKSCSFLLRAAIVITIPGRQNNLTTPHVTRRNQGSELLETIEKSQTGIRSPPPPFTMAPSLIETN
jgi:hypothetical protein